ncbi:histidine kinase [Beutenbergia cavernae DSM 12333]|uniref:histidine kinase n=1 Tax=Beutenbergia cavernae (strain ATCC BAA-8 / DSM 12333 / CCUG 43141 / JCM 11478 / NBRC 16432 / NCIMB 13614 / HKI 0122) TaxID=471853 RepID=C5C475_BEUC1|nr:histidine kinase [Beutenbergia cavernae]ACQ79988.1 histidine kinase [Beutenbergia cavernae DSM 12333]
MSTQRPARRGGVLTDGVLAGVLLAVCLLTAPLLNAWVHGQRPVDVLGYVLLTAACVPLAARRRFPILVLTVTTLAVSGYLVIGYPFGPVVLPLVAAVYTVGRRSTTLHATLAAVGAFLALAAHVVVGPESNRVSGTILAAAWIIVPFTVGVAARLVTESSARERAETERRKVDEERLRLATEVHDIVGHGLAAIQMQADIALHLGARKPDQATIALEAISSASAAALGELRTTLGSVAPGSDGAAGGAPVPVSGLAGIDALCRRTRDAGVAVDLVVEGQPRRLPADVEVAAYRVVQESLTNVVKHAPERRADVRLHFESESVTVAVTSPHDGSPLNDGFGVRGMRRRIESLGGAFTLEHDGAVRVRAVIPSGRGTAPRAPDGQASPD